MHNTITSEIVVAYSQCPRKAFLLLHDELEMPHAYMSILEQQKRHNQTTDMNLFKTLKQTSLEEKPRFVYDLADEGNLITKATLKTECLEAYCDVLTQVKSGSSSHLYYYEPTIIVGTYSIGKEQELELAFTGFVLGQIQKNLPSVGHIVRMGGHVVELKLEPTYRVLKRLLDPLREWLVAASADPPPVILNKHCPSCQFRALCREKAENADDLSLLNRVTPKVIQQYHKKGIFTVKQLSYGR